MKQRNPYKSQLLVLVAVSTACLLFAAAAPVTAAADTETVEGENISLYATNITEFENVSQVEAALANGTLESRNHMAVGETLVIAIESEQLASDIATQNESTTEQFFETLATDANLSLIQSNPF